MLETCLAEVKHKGELKLRHPELLACGSLLHTTIHCKNRWATIYTLPPPAQSPASQHICHYRPARWHTSCHLQTCLGDLQQTEQNTFLLEPHLAKKKKSKQKEETKLQNPESPASKKLLVILRKQEGSITARSCFKHA
jgi:hypothetical protein